jgi:hypothetical protein
MQQSHIQSQTIIRKRRRINENETENDETAMNK